MCYCTRPTFPSRVGWAGGGRRECCNLVSTTHDASYSPAFARSGAPALPRAGYHKNFPFSFAQAAIPIWLYAPVSILKWRHFFFPLSSINLLFFLSFSFGFKCENIQKFRCLLQNKNKTKIYSFGEQMGRAPAHRANGWRHAKKDGDAHAGFALTH